MKPLRQFFLFALIIGHILSSQSWAIASGKCTNSNSLHSRLLQLHAPGEMLTSFKQRLTKLWVNTIKLVTKNRSNVTLVTDQGIVLDLGEQLGKGSRGEALDLKSYSGLPLLDQKGKYIAKLPHTLRGRSAPMASATDSLKRELQIYESFTVNMNNLRSSSHYPKDPSWGESIPLCKIHYSLDSPEGLVLIKDKIKGLSVDKLLQRNGGKLTDEAKNSLKDIYDLNQSLYEKQKITIGNVEAPFSGDIAKGNVMWIEDPEVLGQFSFKRPGFVLLELDVHYKNGPRFINGHMSFDEYLNYIITN